MGQRCQKSRSRLAIWSRSSCDAFPSTPDSGIKAGGEKPKMEINARESVVKTVPLRTQVGDGILRRGATGGRERSL